MSSAFLRPKSDLSLSKAKNILASVFSLKFLTASWPKFAENTHATGKPVASYTLTPVAMPSTTTKVAILPNELKSVPIKNTLPLTCPADTNLFVPSSWMYCNDLIEP